MLPRTRQVPRAPLPTIGRSPCQGGISHHLEGRSPSFIAPTGPCARPTPSRRRRSLPGSAGLCRLLSAPAGGWPFPTLSLRVFPWMQGPVPRRLAGCLYPFLPLRHRPSLRLNQVGAHQIRSAISKRVSFRGCSHSLRFQPPGLLATPIAPTAPARRAGGQPWRFRPSRTRVVTDHVHRIS